MSSDDAKQDIPAKETRTSQREAELEEELRVLKEQMAVVMSSLGQQQRSAGLATQYVPRLSTLLQSSVQQSPLHVPPVAGRLTQAERLEASPYFTPYRATQAPASAARHGGDRVLGGGGARPLIDMSVDEEGWQALLKKEKEPYMFSGNRSEDKTDVRDWVEQVDDFLDTHLKNHQGNRLQWCISHTTGAAKNLLKSFQKDGREAVENGTADRMVEWCDVRHLFIKGFEGTPYQIGLEAEIKALRLGAPKTKDPHTFNAAWDRLCVRVWPTCNTDPHMDKVVGSEYGQAICHSDIDLWEKIVDSVFDPPVGLAEWKMKVLAAWNAREVRKAMLKAGRVAAGSWKDRQQGGQRYGGWSQRPTPPHGVTAKVNVASACPSSTPREPGAETDDSEAEVENSKEEASAQQANAERPPPKNGGRPTWQHRAEVMTWLVDNKRCFRCCGSGHPAFKCRVPLAKLPKSAPTLEHAKVGAWLQ